MKAPDPHAQAVWEHMLPHILSTRRRRTRRRIAGAAAACFGLAMWVTLQGTKPIDRPVVHSDPPLPVLDTIAVMRIDDHGTIRLEEIAACELGTVELALGQTPVLADEMLYW